jgi:hypothetical protein
LKEVIIMDTSFRKLTDDELVLKAEEGMHGNGSITELMRRAGARNTLCWVLSIGLGVANIGLWVAVMLK